MKDGFGQPFKGPIIPFGSLVEYYPTYAKDQSRIHQFGKKVLPGLFLGYAFVRGWNLEGWRTGCRPGVGDDGRIGNLLKKDSMRKRWYFPNKENLFFQPQMDAHFGSSHFMLKASIAHACCADCSLVCLQFLLHPCQPNHLMGRKGWSQMEVPSGCFAGDPSPRPRSQQWPSAIANAPVTAQREVPGRWRQSKGATVASQVPKPRMSPDAAREKAQSSVARLKKALEAMGDVEGPAL